MKLIHLLPALLLLSCSDASGSGEDAPGAGQGGAGASGKGGAAAGAGGAVAGSGGAGGDAAGSGGEGGAAKAGQGGAGAGAGGGAAGAGGAGVSGGGQGGAGSGGAGAGQGGAGQAGSGGAGAGEAGQGGAGGEQGGAGQGGAGGGGAGAGPVDASTMQGKLLLGYQGWFRAQGDGSQLDGWAHWAPGKPGPGNLSFDLWPDLGEFAAGSLFETDLTMADGSKARLYSAYDAQVVDRHFLWMEENELDGVFLQEFVVELAAGSAAREFRDKVTDNVRKGAEAHGRVFAIEYDVSGMKQAEPTADRVIEHWKAMVDGGVVGSGRYLRHKGRPLVGLWGPGFSDRECPLEEASKILDFFQKDGPEQYRATVMGGVPSRWRTLKADSKPEPAWLELYKRYDIINPWLVGRYGLDVEVEKFRKEVTDGDVALCAAEGREYMPVIWPGFSWKNLMNAPLNQIPRRKGDFFWKQFFEMRSAGAAMFFGAMFDEVDEGTAMFKAASSKAQLPVDATFLSLDADGYQLPSDWYLRVCREASRVLRGQAQLSASLPIAPPEPACDPPHSIPKGGKCVPSCGAAGGVGCNDAAACAGKTPIESHDCAICCLP